MAQFDLYIDVYAGALVKGPKNSAPGVLPPLVQGDSPTLRIFLLYPTNNPVTPYTFVGASGTGLSLQVAIGDKIGNATNYYTQQFLWAVSADPGNTNYFIATLPMNTAAITTLLGGNASANSTFQVVYIQGGLQTTVLEIACTINASVIKGGGVIVPPGVNPVTLEYVNATFMKGSVAGFFLANNNTNKKVFVYLGDDNEVHFDPVN